MSVIIMMFVLQMRSHVGTRAICIRNTDVSGSKRYSQLTRWHSHLPRRLAGRFVPVIVKPARLASEQTRCEVHQANQSRSNAAVSARAKPRHKTSSNSF